MPTPKEWMKEWKKERSDRWTSEKTNKTNKQTNNRKITKDPWAVSGSSEQNPNGLALSSSHTISGGVLTGNNNAKSQKGPYYSVFWCRHISRQTPSPIKKWNSVDAGRKNPSGGEECTLMKSGSHNLCVHHKHNYTEPLHLCLHTSIISKIWYRIINYLSIGLIIIYYTINIYECLC
jgi:hypothetical protein